MSKTLRWVIVLLPCSPGLMLLLAGVTLAIIARGEGDAGRIEQLYTAGGAVLLAGLVIGAVVAWRIAHARPETEEEEEPPSPGT